MRNRRSPSYWKSATAAETTANDASPLPPAPHHGGFALRRERPEDAAGVNALIEAVFGPGRLVKTAERLREANSLRADLTFCAWSDAVLAASVRMWPIEIGGAAAVFLGPLTVDPSYQGEGAGRALVRHACEAAADAGDAVVLLVGSAAYFTPLGFEPVPPGRLRMPGPVDPGRLLWRGLFAGALEPLGGPVGVPPKA